MAAETGHSSIPGEQKQKYAAETGKMNPETNNKEKIIQQFFLSKQPGPPRKQIMKNRTKKAPFAGDEYFKYFIPRGSTSVPESCHAENQKSTVYCGGNDEVITTACHRSFSPCRLTMHKSLSQVPGGVKTLTGIPYLNMDGKLFTEVSTLSLSGRFPDLRIIAVDTPSHMCGHTMVFCIWLPDHSDRIVRDSHPVPS